MKKFSKHWRYPLWLAAIILGVWWLFFGYRYGFIYNHGQSMEPTHSNGDILIIEKSRFLGGNWKPDRTDVVVIRDKESGDDLTKRVIALEAETVIIRLLEGEFPEYAEIIKKEVGFDLPLNRNDFTMMLKHV